MFFQSYVKKPFFYFEGEKKGNQMPHILFNSIVGKIWTTQNFTVNSNLSSALVNILLLLKLCHQHIFKMTKIRVKLRKESKMSIRNRIEKEMKTN